MNKPVPVRPIQAQCHSRRYMKNGGHNGGILCLIKRPVPNLVLQTSAFNKLSKHTKRSPKALGVMAGGHIWMQTNVCPRLCLSFKLGDE